MSTPQQIAEHLLGHVEWSGTMGYATCPGESLHKHRSAKRHCRVYLNGAPTIYCVHESCESVRSAKQAELRAALRGQSFVQWTPTAEDKRRFEQRKRDDGLRDRARKSLPMILQKFAITENAFRDSSPHPLNALPEHDWHLLLSLFAPDDVLWIGETFDSGKPENTGNFKPVKKWTAAKNLPNGWNFTCPSTFKAGSFSRSNDQVLNRRFLVCESDTLQREQMLALFRWMQTFLTLRAVVDTGGKSLHGWFEFPSEPVLKELCVMLPKLGFDRALFKPSQPVRLPGTWRGEKKSWQSLIWFKHE